MKLSYNWLRQYCPFQASPKAVAERLTMAGLEVEEIHPVGDDFCFEAEVTTNRPDWLSIIGAARELAALYDIRLQLPSICYATSPPAATDATSVEVRDADLCPRYTAQIIRDVKVGPSPSWLVKALEAVGLRSINNIVDVTNFVLMECGQPLHAFDFEKLVGRKIIVRRAKPKEKIVLIDGSERELTNEHLVIADELRPVALAGVMGGQETEVTLSTKTVLLESALFDPLNIRRTSRALKISTDSSYRFERSVDPNGVEWASRRVAAMIAENGWGEIAEGFIDINAADLNPWRVELRIARLNALLGTSISADESARVLERLGLTILEKTPDRLNVEVPTFRSDLTREVDLIEEVARIYGYDRIPDKPRVTISAGEISKQERVEEIARTFVEAAGFSEAVTISFVNAEWDKAIRPWSDSDPVTLMNPVRKDENALRRSLIPSLLNALRINQHRAAQNVDLYEIARVYLPKTNDVQPDERLMLGLVSSKEIASVKGVIEALLDRLDIRAMARALDLPFLATSGAVEWTIGGRRLIVFGPVTRQIAERFDLRNRPVVAEIDLNELCHHANLARTFRPLPQFPPVRRDLAIVVDEQVTWDAVRTAVEKSLRELLAGIEFFDFYRGKQIPRGKKSLAFSITLQAADRTLTGEEADQALQTAMQALRSELGAMLRGEEA